MALFLTGSNTETDSEDQDGCGDQRQCGSDPGADGADRDAGVEVPANEIEVRLVAIDVGGFAAAAVVLLSRSVGVAGRPFWCPTGAGRSA